MKYNLDDMMREVYQEKRKPHDILNQRTLRKMKESGRMKKTKSIKWNIAAAAIVGVFAISGVGVYASGIIRQLHITSDNHLRQMMQDGSIKKWENLSYQSGTFNEAVFKNSRPRSFVDILLSDPERYTVKKGSTKDGWIRRISAKEDGTYYEAYEYEKLSDMFADYHIAFDLSYIEKHFPTVTGEYGCDFTYADSSKTDCLQRRFFSGYTDSNGRIVGIEYNEDYENQNSDPCDLYENSTTTGYYDTKDGAEVFLTKRSGTDGGKMVNAEVMTKHAALHINLYGDFTEKEVETILNSIEIVKAMGVHEY